RRSCWTGPDPAVDGVVRWRTVDLCRWVAEDWGVSYSETGMLRLLWSLDLSHRKTRPRHPPTDEEGAASLQKDPMGEGRSSSSRVRRPTSYPGDRQCRSRPAPCRPSPPSVLRCLSLWN